MIAEEVQPAFQTCFEQLVCHEDTDIFSGFKPLDLGKLETMIIYFAHSLRGVFKTKINKLLWYADFLRFKQSAVSISGSKYRHLPFGPVPDNYELILGNMVDHEKLIEIQEHIYDAEKDIVGEKIVAKVEPDLSVLEDGDLRIIDFVAGRFRDVSASEISRISHEEKAFKDTSPSEYISYKYAEDLSLPVPDS